MFLIFLLRRLSPSPSNTPGPRTLAARSKPVRVRGTNHLPWLEISLFLQQQTWGRR